MLPEIEGESPLAEVSAGGDSDAHQREAPRLGSLGPTANVTKDIQDTIPEQLTKAKTQWLGAPGGEPDPAAVGGGGQPQAHAAIAATSAVQVVTARLKKRKAETLAPAGNDQRRISAFFGKGPKTAIDTGHRSVLSQLVDERISCIAASANGRARKVGRKR